MRCPSSVIVASLVATPQLATLPPGTVDLGSAALSLCGSVCEWICGYVYGWSQQRHSGGLGGPKFETVFTELFVDAKKRREASGNQRWAVA